MGWRRWGGGVCVVDEEDLSSHVLETEEEGFSLRLAWLDFERWDGYGR